MDCGEQCATICGPQPMQLWGANFLGIQLMVSQFIMSEILLIGVQLG